MRLIVITICLCFLLLGFSNTENFKKKEKAPPGTVRLNDSLFIDKYEATNLSWREFIYWLKNISQDSIYCNQVYPDTTVWLNHYLRLNDSSFYTNIPFKDYYFTHPSHNEYPVVGITYEQANAYCNWRSDRVNELSLKKPKKNPFPKKRYKYRLPTIDEWQYTATGKFEINRYPYGMDSICVYSKKERWVTINSLYYKTNKYFLGIADVSSFLPNDFGIHNMIGNVRNGFHKGHCQRRQFFIAFG